MAWKQLANAAALSEFVAGYNGDCGETAELAALHVVTGLALTAADLRAIVQRDQAHGWASSNGSEPLTAIAHDLDLLQVAYDLYGFRQPANFDWKSLLRAEAGNRPVILQLALAGVLPGDETGVHFHFVAALGGDAVTDIYALADGDNAAARSGQLVRYSIAQLEAAQVCGAIVLHMPAQGPSTMLDITNPIVARFFALLPSGAWHCAATNTDLFGGILDFYRATPAAGTLNGLSALGLPLTGEIAPKTGSAARVRIFERGAICYDPKRELDTPLGVTGDCYIAHINSGAVQSWLTQAAIQAATATLQQQLTATQTAEAAAQVAEATAQQQAQAAQAQVATLQQQMQQAGQQFQSQIAQLQAQITQLQTDAAAALQLAAAIKILNS